MTLPALARFTDETLLLLRVMIGLVFFTSGWKHASDPETRSKDIEMSNSLTRFLGIAVCNGALGVLFGVLTPIASIGLMVIMPGSIQRKIVKWKTGFGGKHGTDGWSYDSMMLIMNLVVATTGGGGLVLENIFRSVGPHA